MREIDKTGVGAGVVKQPELLGTAGEGPLGISSLETVWQNL